MRIFKFGKKKKKRTSVDLDKIDVNNEAFFRIQAKKDGEDVIFSTDIAGRSDMIVNVMLQWASNDPEFESLMFMLADNLVIRKTAKMTGRSVEEVAKDMKEQAEMSRLKQFMGKGGTEA